MEIENKKTKEYTMEFGEANLYAFLLAIPIMAILLTPFILIWDYETLKTGAALVMDHFFLIVIGGIIIHELLHGLTWGYFAPNRMKSIKFGIKMFTPYCHCTEPLKVKHYRIGGAMPLLLLGIVPSIIGLIIGHGGFLAFGVFFTIAAGGDIIALFMLRKLDNETYISDHPNKMGFYREID